MPFSRYRTLIRSLGFQSFLWTQFLGAFNDNIYKIVLSMVAVNVSGVPGEAGRYVSLAGAVFIVPFLLFSGYAGYFADKYPKRSVLVTMKGFEIFAVGVGLSAFYTGSMALLYFGLFLMATHSTFFSPSKYGILPEMLPYKDLSVANGLLEMSTFLAIIIGTSLGTILYSVWKATPAFIGFFLLAVSAGGLLISLGIPRVPPSGSSKPFSLNPISEIGAGLKRIYSDRTLFLTVAGITYFWFIGALLQMDLLLLGKEVMGLSDFKIGLLVTFLAVGIGAGSVLSGRLSGDKIEPGLAPIGSVGMGLTFILLTLSTQSYYWTAAVLAFLGVFAGLFIVPLNALIQKKSGHEEKGRIIATNNFVNTLGILGASLSLWLMRDLLDIQADAILLFFGVLTLAFTLLTLKVIPEFFVRFTLWLLTHTAYRIRIAGREHIPSRGPALLVSNHMSFVDGLLVGACMQRFVRFMVYSRFCELWPLKRFLRLMMAIPVADGTRREVVESITKARKALAEGHVVCIFAEGMITRTGNLLPFKKGFERIVEGLDVPIIPVHLDRVWGSVFSFKRGKFFWKLPERFPYPVTVSFGPPLEPGATGDDVRRSVMELGSLAFEHRIRPKDTLQGRFIRAAKRRFFTRAFTDSGGRSFTYGMALTAGLLLADWIRARCKGEDCIGIMLPSTSAGAVSNIAALLSGKIPVNLNFASGAESVASAVRQARIRTVITSRLFLAKAGIEETGGMVFLEDITEGVTGTGRALKFLSALLIPSFILTPILCGARSKDSIATIMFTSGSTGEPKGVMLTHRNILSNIEGFSQVFFLDRRDVLLGVLPFFHSFGFTATLWFPLLCGVQAVYHPNPSDAKTVGELSRSHRATILMATPTFFSMYMKKCSKEEFSTLRYAIAGAEKLRASLADGFSRKFGIDILEGYGCTELSPVVSVNVPDIMHKEVRQTGHRRGTVGHALPGVAVKIIDVESGAPLPPGRPGILLVKGPNLMAGYLGDSVRTENALKDGWYVTGDIAEICDDGFIRITDRVSRFSKIGGEMVPHIKIEEAVSSITGGDSAVTSVPDEAKGERVVVFHTCRYRKREEIWEALLKTDLPRLWIPKREDIRFIEEIPLTALGKADMRRIKALAEEFAARVRNA